MSEPQPLPSLSPTAGQTSDTRLIERAIKQRWPVKPEDKAAVVRRMTGIVKNKKASKREATSAAKALIACEAQNQSDEHHATGQEIHITGEQLVTIQVVEDEHWYGNKAHALAAEAAAVSDPDSTEPGQVQDHGVRAPLGQNGSRPAGGD